MRRLQGDGPPIRLRGFIQPPLFFQDDAQVVVRLGMIGVERQDLLIGGLRVCETSQLFVGVPEIGAGFDVAGIPLDGLAIGLDRVHRASGALQHDAVIEPVDRIARTGGTGLRQPPERVFQIAAPVGQEAQTMEGVRLCRCALEQGPVGSFRFIQTSGLVMQLRLAQKRR